MLKKVVDRGIVTGLLGEFRQGGIMALQYAGDTILFSKAEESVLKNLKCILMWYEQISSMRINFHKSEMIPINLEDDEVHRLAHILSCPVGKFPIKYLGIPLYFDVLTRDDIQPLGPVWIGGNPKELWRNPILWKCFVFWCLE